MNEIFGGLIKFENEKEFQNFIDNGNNEELFKIIEKGIEYAYMKGIYTMDDTFYIYKSILKIKNNGFEISDLSNNNSDRDVIV